MVGEPAADRVEEACLRREAANQVEWIGLGGRLFDAAGTLPLGSQRMVEIARALCADPLLLLLDEPAAGQRYQEKQALAEVLRALRQRGVSILLVEHDMEFVMGLVDRIAVMNFGEKLAEGSPRRCSLTLRDYAEAVRWCESAIQVSHGRRSAVP